MRRAPAALLLPAALLSPALVAQAPASAPTDAAAEAKRADIRKLLNLMHTGEAGVAGMHRMVDAMKATNQQLPAEFWDEFLKAATAEKIVEISVPVYEKHLTAGEVKAYLAFAATPEGAAIMAKLPVINDEAMAAGQAWGQQLGLEVAQKLHAEGKL
ncbi:MAG TPA: DUF2059 domain-containing protein [Holophagaceae bacterium]|nr:DUF2059 domain-containing protein [Holophagaceae bacterium]